MVRALQNCIDCYEATLHVAHSYSYLVIFYNTLKGGARAPGAPPPPSPKSAPASHITSLLKSSDNE